MCELEFDTNKHEDLNLLLANHGEEDELYPLAAIEIAKAQKNDQELMIYYKKILKTANIDKCF
jgi:hypothetical protein